MSTYSMVRLLFPGAFNGNNLEKLNFDYLITVDIRTRYLHLSVTAIVIVLFHVDLINVVYLTACAFIRSL